MLEYEKGNGVLTSRQRVIVIAPDTANNRDAAEFSLMSGEGSREWLSSPTPAKRKITEVEVKHLGRAGVPPALPSVTPSKLESLKVGKRGRERSSNSQTFNAAA